MFLASALPALPQAARTIALDPARMKLSNVKAERVTYKGREAIRLTDTGPENLPDGAHFALLPGTEFSNGTIEVELAGDRTPTAPEGARGFTGMAFRAAADGSAAYECFYLRPYNGRSEDQLQRNHSAQYMSLPGFGWRKLREETPGKYETYVDLVPGAWTRVKIEARGDKARLYVDGAQQPVLIVNDLKRGASKGALALWINGFVVAHFANLRVSP
jgi:hypothetical protein